MAATLTHDDIDVPGLCSEHRDLPRTLVGDGPFDVRLAVQAYLDAGEEWTDVVRAYQAMVNVGALPDVGLVWRIARIAFRELPENCVHLRQYGETLGPENWHEARNAAEDAATAAYATFTAASATAATAATAASAAAEIRVQREIIEMVLTEVERVLPQRRAR